MNLHVWLLLASALFSIGVYGALSQQSIVMIMMGLELMLNGAIAAGGAFWFYLAPARPDGQVLDLVAILVMTIEMAIGFAAGHRANRFAPAIAIAVACLTAALAVVVAVGQPAVQAPFLAGLPFPRRVDGLSAAFVLTTASVTLLVLVFSASELADDPGRHRFFGLMLLFAAAMLVTVTGASLLSVLSGWEMMGAASYALIGFWWREPRRVDAANVAFWTTRTADVGLYIAAGAALAGGSGLALTALPAASGGWRDLLTAGVITAALGKSAQLPFSFWLSRAMEGPSPVSALLHSAAMVAAGGYLLLRLHPLLAATGWGSSVVAWAGAVTALLLGVVAIAQTDLKQLLAASTCSQIGFIVLAGGAGGIAGGTMQFVAHAATKSLLFLAAGAWLTALGTKDLTALRGAARRYPLVGLTAGAGLWTLAGLPPFGLWVSKDEVLAAALERSPALYAVGLAGVLVSGAYAVKALALLWAPLPADAESGYDTERRGTRHVGLLGRPVLLVLAVAAAVSGLQALPAISGPYRRALGVLGEPTPRWWELALSAAIAALAAAAAAWRPTLPLPSLALRWLDLQRAADMLVGRPTLRLSRALARFDDRLLDGAVVDRAVAGGVRMLGSLARRPQTGQLHQYYAQAAGALAVLFAVFWLVW